MRQDALFSFTYFVGGANNFQFARVSLDRPTYMYTSVALEPHVRVISFYSRVAMPLFPEAVSLLSN